MKCQNCDCCIDNCHECSVGRHQYKLPDSKCNHQAHHDTLFQELKHKIEMLEFRCDRLEVHK